MQIELGVRRTWKGHGTKRCAIEKKDTFSYVPILSVLEKMLHNQSIFEQV